MGKDFNSKQRQFFLTENDGDSIYSDFYLPPLIFTSDCPNCLSQSTTSTKSSHSTQFNLNENKIKEMEKVEDLKLRSRKDENGESGPLYISLLKTENKASFFIRIQQHLLECNFLYNFIYLEHLWTYGNKEWLQVLVIEIRAPLLNKCWKHCKITIETHHPNVTETNITIRFDSFVSFVEQLSNRSPLEFPFFWEQSNKI